jgi:hypothetical protein
VREVTFKPCSSTSTGWPEKIGRWQAPQRAAEAGRPSGRRLIRAQSAQTIWRPVLMFRS